MGKVIELYPKGKTFNRRGNVFLVKKDQLHVLCNDSKFHRINREKFETEKVIEIDKTHNVFFEPIEMY